MSRRNITVIALMLFGAAIIGIGFVLACRRWGYTDRNWLSLVVATFVYGAWWFVYYNRRPRNTSVDSSLSSLGLQWLALSVYTLAAITIIIAGYVLSVSSEVLLLVHLSTLFILGLAFAAANGVTRHLIHSSALRNASLDGLSQMRRNAKRIATLAAQIQGLNSELMQRIIRHAEEVECLSGCATPEAKEFERTIIELQQRLEAMLSGVTQTSVPDMSLLNSISTTTKMRKNCEN